MVLSLKFDKKIYLAVSLKQPKLQRVTKRADIQKTDRHIIVGHIYK